MKDFLTTVIDMVTKSLKEHGLFKTCGVLIALLAALALCLLVWQAPDIIRALQGR